MKGDDSYGRNAHDTFIQNHFLDFLEACFDGVAIADADANLIIVNSAYEKMTGIRREEIAGQNIGDLIKTGVIEDAVVYHVTKTRITTTMTHYYQRTGKSLMVTGSPVLNEKGALAYVIANFRDITKLNELRKRLGDDCSGDNSVGTLYLEPELADIPDYGIMIHNNRMKKCVQKAVRVAQFDTPVFILGESGTGKTKMAEIIHKSSHRSKRPFISINCGAIPENLLESELFGYERGAFTGADTDGKIGQFELADGGTLVLDEIAELGLSLQVKLLKAIEERKFLRIGGTAFRDVDIRIIAVTNQDLKQMVNNQKFRKDLYYRLRVVPITVPALRERRDEIPLLVRYFFEHFNSKYGTHKCPDHTLIKALGRFNYPGNVRELKNLIEHLVIMSPEALITADDLEYVTLEPENGLVEISYDQHSSIQEYLEECEKKAIAEILKNNKTLRYAARRLGISDATLWRKMKKYGLQGGKTTDNFQTE
jgi:PAS domain S-box-containing protein